MLKYQPKSMLITGGAGFIGSNYIRYILSLNINILIVNIDKLTYAGSLKNLKNLPNAEAHHFIQGDICNNQLIATLLRQYDIDTIVHFAAESHVDRSISGPHSFIETNIVGTFSMLEAAKQYWLDEKKFSDTDCRFHHISTDEVFGALKLRDHPFHESTPYNPRSPYSATKAGSDHLVRSYHSTYRLPITITNCSNNYGPYQHEEKFIPTVIRSCVNNQSIPIYGTGKNIRDWLYVEDHCKMLHKVICDGKIGESYNIGGEFEIDNLALAKKICHKMDEIHSNRQPHERLINFVSDRKGHDFRYAINMNKLKQANLWEKPLQFEDGLNKTIEFYLYD